MKINLEGVCVKCELFIFIGMLIKKRWGDLGGVRDRVDFGMKIYVGILNVSSIWF